MRDTPTGDWPDSPREAIALQQHLRSRVIARDDFVTPHHVAGVDVGFEDRGRITRAAVAVLRYPDLGLAEQSISRQPTRFPYIPGLLSFRELPAVLAALNALQTRPDMLLCDGQGLAHPRRFGIACHLGVLTGIPSIGVAKTRLIGTHAEVPDRRGAWTTLLDHGEEVGAVLRSRAGVKPIFVSIGHRIGLQSAIDLVMACTTRYRLPETTRHAHRLASQQ